MKNFPSVSGLLPALVNAALPLVAIMFIYRQIYPLPVTHPQAWFLAIWAAISMIGWLLGFSEVASPREAASQRLFLVLYVCSLFFYVACCALCAKLQVACWHGACVQTIGFVLLIIGAGLRIHANYVLGNSNYLAIQPGHFLIEQGAYRWVRHPSYLGFLLMLSSIPLLFNTWFPLFALPGAWVAIKQRMENEEKLLSKHFGASYLAYLKRTWRILPGLY